MEQFHALAPIIAHDIEQCTATYPNGMPWHSQVHPETKRTRYTIRTWDGVARNGHNCWVKFHIQESGDTSLVDVNLCHLTTKRQYSSSTSSSSSGRITALSDTNIKSRPRGELVCNVWGTQI